MQWERSYDSHVYPHFRLTLSLPKFSSPINLKWSNQQQSQEYMWLYLDFFYYHFVLIFGSRSLIQYKLIFSIDNALCLSLFNQHELYGKENKQLNYDDSVPRVQIDKQVDWFNFLYPQREIQLSSC